MNFYLFLILFLAVINSHFALLIVLSSLLVSHSIDQNARENEADQLDASRCERHISQQSDRRRVHLLQNGQTAALVRKNRCANGRQTRTAAWCRQRSQNAHRPIRRRVQTTAFVLMWMIQIRCNWPLVLHNRARILNENIRLSGLGPRKPSRSHDDPKGTSALESTPGSRLRCCSANMLQWRFCPPATPSTERRTEQNKWSIQVEHTIIVHFRKLTHQRTKHTVFSRHVESRIAPQQPKKAIRNEMIPTTRRIIGIMLETPPLLLSWSRLTRATEATAMMAKLISYVYTYMCGSLSATFVIRIFG